MPTKALKTAPKNISPKKIAPKKAAANKAAAKRPGKIPARGARAGTSLGALPEWDLADLYAGLDDPAIRRDLDRADGECAAFEAAYKGKLDAMARGSDAGAKLAAAVRRYEALDDLMGRLGSYAGLIHAGDTVDPARNKFYGDVQERLTTASTTACSKARWPIRRSAITVRGSKTYAAISRINWRIASSSCFTKNR